MLISDTMSLPAATTQRAKSATRVTFGLSFVISGRVVAARTARTTRSAIARSVPKAMPPSLMLGQETLTSRAATPSSAESTPASSPNSSTPQA